MTHENEKQPNDVKMRINLTIQYAIFLNYFAKHPNMAEWTGV
jgi:hypothetical protein